MRLKVAIADDSFLIREGLRQVLSFAPDLEVVGAHADPEALLSAVDTQAPDVVMTDIRMPPTHTDEGMQVAERLRITHPAVGVVVLSQHGNAEYAAQLLASGASGRGYLLKDRIHDLDHLVSTITAVAAGECRVDAQLVDELVARQRTPSRSPLDDLTPRQHEVLGRIAAGHSNAAIARDFGLTQRAVEKHVSEIFSRLGLANDETISRRVHATLLYLMQPKR
ncbi:MAG TPA: response regulator transcription factor [Aquabacterium sp.]|jgi:DNA-binding NarL/FixJ family response regulator|nr:response regulator transcription factor [Aquabacterium sp.]HQC96480.1 response regulator transcription factor [Aquabacterium sp.]